AGRQVPDELEIAAAETRRVVLERRIPDVPLHGGIPADLLGGVVHPPHLFTRNLAPIVIGIGEAWNSADLLADLAALRTQKRAVLPVDGGVAMRAHKTGLLLVLRR